MSRPPTVFTGDVFGRLTVVKYAGMKRGRDRTYLCRCECGTETTVPGYLLRSGNTRSCGCLKTERARESMRTHGHTAMNGRKSPTYESWRAMINRCKPSYKGSEWYAARGITVDESWRGRTGFSQFLADMGKRPRGMTLDRVDPDGNYEPENCQWASRRAQSLNKRPRARLSEVDALRAEIAELRARLT